MDHYIESKHIKLHDISMKKAVQLIQRHNKWNFIWKINVDEPTLNKWKL